MPAAVTSRWLLKLIRRNYKANPQKDTPHDRNDADKTEYALGIWQNSVPVPNTLAGTYLQSCGLHLNLPSTLRFHGELKHPSGGLWPAMVAFVSWSGRYSTGHSSHNLTLGGSGKSPVDPQKMMVGPCRGGAFWLGTPTDLMMVVEASNYDAVDFVHQSDDGLVQGRDGISHTLGNRDGSVGIDQNNVRGPLLYSLSDAVADPSINAQVLRRCL